MDSSIGRTFSSGVFQARNDIPNYNRFVFGVDYTEAFALALLKQEAPNLYQEYQDILAGNKTMKSKRTLDFTRQGKGVIKAIKSTPAVEAQQFLSQVSGQLLWSLLKIPVTLQTYDENGHLVTQDFALQRNQVNYVDEWICETGNIAAPYYSDNGITLIPLQLTNSSIYANLKRAIETGEWWSVVSQKIHFDIGAEKTDTNGKGEVKVYYMPPGENFIYSWSNLEMNQNANYSTPFAYAEGKTSVWIKLSNRIGNNGEYQSVRNTIERVNTSNIVNSAGIIAILSNRRDQFGRNPCLEHIPNNTLISLDQIEQIVPDGSCRVTAVIQTRGDNPNSQADEVYRQIGRMLIDGEIATGDGSETANLNSNPNKPGQGIINNNSGGLSSYAVVQTVGQTRHGQITQEVDPFKAYMKKIYEHRKRFKLIKLGKIDPSSTNADSTWNYQSNDEITALYGLTSGLTLYNYNLNNSGKSVLDGEILSEPLFLLKPNIYKLYSRYDTLQENFLWFGCVKSNMDSFTPNFKYGIKLVQLPLVDNFWITDNLTSEVILNSCPVFYIYHRKDNNRIYLEDTLGLSVTQTIINLGNGSTNENTNQQSSQPSLTWGVQANKGVLANGSIDDDNAPSLLTPAVRTLTSRGGASKNFNLAKILNIAQVALGTVTQVVSAVTNVPTSDEVQFTSYQAQRIAPINPTTVHESTDMPTTINYEGNDRIAEVTGIPNIKKYNGTPYEENSLSQQLVNYANDYSQFFSTVIQSTDTPGATRYAIQYEGTLSYNYNAMSIYSCSMTTWTLNMHGQTNFVNIVQHTIKFMCVLTSVLSNTISMQELLQYSVKISDNDDIWTTTLVDNDVQQITSQSTSDSNYYISKGDLTGSEKSVIFTLPYQETANINFVPILTEYVSGAVRISSGGIYCLPETLPSPNGPVNITSDTSITIYPVLTAQVGVEIVGSGYIETYNTSNKYIGIIIVPISSEKSFQPQGNHLNLSDTNKASTSNLFSLNTTSLTVTQIDPMGNVPSSEA